MIADRRDWVALVLAIGLATALNTITVAILYDAIRDPAQAGISENAVQVLTGWGGGVIGILGAVFGYRAGRDVAGVDIRGRVPPDVGERNGSPGGVPPVETDGQ